MKDFLRIVLHGMSLIFCIALLMLIGMALLLGPWALADIYNSPVFYWLYAVSFLVFSFWFGTMAEG